MSTQQPDNNTWTKHSNKQSSNSRGFSSQPRGRGRGSSSGSRGGSSQRGARGGYTNQSYSTTTQPQTTTTQSTSNNGPSYRGGRPNGKFYPPQHNTSQNEEDEEVTTQSQSQQQPIVHPKPVKSSMTGLPMRTASAPPTTNSHQQRNSPFMPQNKSSTSMMQKSRRTGTGGLNPKATIFVPQQSHVQPQQQQQQQQTYAPNSVHQPHHHQLYTPQQQYPNPEPIAFIPPPKEKKILIITNPTTHKAINIDADEDEKPEEEQELEKEKESEKEKEQEQIKSEEPVTEKEIPSTAELSKEEPSIEEANADKLKEVGDEIPDYSDDEDEEGDEEYDEEDDEEEDGSDYSCSEDEEDEMVNGKRVWSRNALLEFASSAYEPPAEIKGIEIFFDPTSDKNQTSKYSTGYIPKPSRGYSTSRHPRTDSGSSPLPRGGYKKGSKEPFSKSLMRGSSKSKGRSSRSGGKTRGGKDNFESLTRSENAWKVGQTKDEADKIYKEVTFILNILTPEKYDVLKSVFLNIKIDTEDVLGGVIDLIFEKAVYEPNFAGLYAKLCKDMANQVGGPDETKDEKIQAARLNGFKRTLLNKCQNEFEAETKAASEDLSSMNELELEERATKLRRRKIGNIIFIGELFDKKMLSEKIIHEVIKKLLIESNPNTREDDLERLCKLLTTIGKSLDHDKAARYMDLYFSKMRDASNDKTLSSRIRFMLLDCIELRESAWVPRIKTAKAKTIKEVHADAEKEKKQKELSLKSKGTTSSGKGYYKNDSRDSRDNRDNRDNRDRGVSTPTNRGPKRSASNNDMFQTKERDKQQRKKTYDRQYKTNDVRLGPSPTTNAWNRDKNEKDMKPVTKKEEVTASNAYALLNDESQSADDYESSEEKEPEVEETLDTERVEDRTRGVFNTWVEEGDKEASILEFNKENFSKDALTYSMRCFVYLCINKHSDLSEYFKFLKTMYEEKMISTDAIRQGLSMALTDILSTEFHLDAPKAFKIFGQLYGRIIFEKMATFDDIAETLSTLVSSNNITGNQTIEVLVSLMSTIVEEHEYADDDYKLEKSRETLFLSSFNFLNIIESSHKKQVKSYATQIKDNKLEALDAIASILLFAEDNVSNDAADSNLLDFLHKTLGDDSVLSSVPYSTKIFSALLVAGEHLDKTKDFVSQYQKTFQTILANEDAQAKCITEIQKYSTVTKNWDQFATSVKLFLDHNLFTSSAIDQWKKDKSEKQEAIKAFDKDHIMQKLVHIGRSGQ